VDFKLEKRDSLEDGRGLYILDIVPESRPGALNRKLGPFDAQAESARPNAPPLERFSVTILLLDAELMNRMIPKIPRDLSYEIPEGDEEPVRRVFKIRHEKVRSREHVLVVCMAHHKASCWVFVMRKRA